MSLRGTERCELRTIDMGGSLGTITTHAHREKNKNRDRWIDIKSETNATWGVCVFVCVHGCAFAQ